MLLVACLAAANMPQESETPPDRRPRAAAMPTPDAIAVDVGTQASRLQARMAQAPVPDSSPRNPFSFGAPPHAARTPSAVPVASEEPAAPLPPPLPALILMGVAEETTSAGPHRTAVIGGDGDTIYMVREGDAVGERYRVKKIGADAVELEDLVTNAYRRLALR
jgi:hypothetical protein